MRNLPDRIRHTLIFEAVAILLVAFPGAWITGQDAGRMGVMTIMFSLLAMSWNLVYNWLFDRAALRMRIKTPRTIRTRIVHALLFEAGMLIAGVFLIAWWLKMSLYQALVLDVGFAVFFLIYAFVYNWAYDLVFPLPLEGNQSIQENS